MDRADRRIFASAMPVARHVSETAGQRLRIFVTCTGHASRNPKTPTRLSSGVASTNDRGAARIRTAVQECGFQSATLCCHCTRESMMRPSASAGQGQFKVQSRTRTFRNSPCRRRSCRTAAAGSRPTTAPCSYCLRTAGAPRPRRWCRRAIPPAHETVMQHPESSGPQAIRFRPEPALGMSFSYGLARIPCSSMAVQATTADRPMHGHGKSFVSVSAAHTPVH